MRSSLFARRTLAALVASLGLIGAVRSGLAQVLYFADVDVVNASADPDRNAIRALDLTNNQVHGVIATGDGVRGLDVDPATSKIYWTDVNNFVIRRANLSGAGQQDVYNIDVAFPSALRLDLLAGKVYWGDQSNEIINRANLDGTAAEPAVAGIPFFRGLAIDHAGGKVYWSTSDTSTSGRIFRANMDGTNFELIISGLAKPGNIALDVAGDRVYWTDAIAKVVRRAHLNGSDVQTLFAGNDFIGSPKGLTLDLPHGKLYWSNDFFDFDSGGFLHGDILRMNLDGTGQEPIATGLGSVNDMVIGPAAAPPCVADFNHADGITVSDIFDFLGAWFAGSPSADINGGGLAVSDIFDFLAAWFAGC